MFSFLALMAASQLKLLAIPSFGHLPCSPHVPDVVLAAWHQDGKSVISTKSRLSHRERKTSFSTTLGHRGRKFYSMQTELQADSSAVKTVLA